MASGLHVSRSVLVLIVACACALAVEWVVLTTFVFPVPRPFDGWSAYSKEYYDISVPWGVGSASMEYYRTRAKELAKQTDGVVNVADAREALCQIWYEQGVRMPHSGVIDRAYTNGFESNATIVPNSKIDTLEKAYLALEIWEYASVDHERIIELLALDIQ